jgi:deoxyribodipyrimidine photolyase-related protein
MQAYVCHLQQSGFTVHYIEAQTAQARITRIVADLHVHHISSIHYVDVVDDWLSRRLGRAAKEYGIRLVQYPTPQFLNSLDAVEPFFESHERRLQTDFYIAQRKQRGLLLQDNGPR